MHFLFAIVAAIAALVGLSAVADDRPAARLGGEGAFVEDTGGGVKLSIALTRPVRWRLKVADDPARVVVELSDFIWSDRPELRSTSIAAIDVVATGPALSELQLVLREPLGIVSAEMLVDDVGAAVLDVRLAPSTADAFQSDLDAEEITPTPKRTVIAIDPGHGGRDPGAESGAIQEAALVLEFAERLRDTLLASGRFEVVLTRSDDSTVSLDARLSRARESDADVLLSIHADALENADAASGVVLYRLAPEAVAAANKRLSERHSPDDRLSGLDLAEVSEDVSHALFDVARRESEPRTIALSGALLQAMHGADLVVNSRPERTAGFAVLKAADIPSLLIELGFLSTEADLARLTSNDWQTTAAEAIRDGLILWSEEDTLR